MKFLNFVLIASLVFLNSCYTMKVVNVEVNYAPKFSFKPDSSTILLINQVDLSKTKSKDLKTLNIIKASAFTAIRYAETHLRQLPHVRVINIVDSAAFNVDTTSIKALALKYHADYVLSLKDFSTGVDMDDLKTTLSYYSINTKTDFILYEANGIYSKKLDGSVSYREYEDSDLDLITTLIAHPGVKKNRLLIKTSAAQATDDALYDYLRHSVAHVRQLVNSDGLQPAADQILAHNLNKADSLLQPFLHDKNKYIASWAAYDMAIVYEMGGYIDQAFKEAQFSISTWRDNPLAPDLLRDLDEE